MALPDVTTSGGPPPELTRSANRVDFVLPATAESVAEARRRTRHHIDAWPLASGSRDEAALVMSELVTNAVVHTDSRTVTCTLAATVGQLLVQVRDSGTGESTPEPSCPPLHRPGGRGLMIVETVSRCWGASRPADGGHVVWAVIETSSTADR
ncbi:ATP-binding protein [Streptomyces roseirectus]|uniref:ATP-binding protein n=1 Tax=Streptomyces roseirectus TaxID=2768066 RepID=A0A7H0IQA5_9ACTN|nr:ATP-binding protein [Streptomyces roseirectus]QNP74971.1 ATP-binding protein [Streptomyces roseirectus]